MSPWNIIAWIVLVPLLGAIALTGYILLAGGVLRAKKWTRDRVRHYRTRSIPPREGQVWMQGEGRLYIGHRYDSGRFSVTTYPPRAAIRSGASWSEAPEEWERRVRERKLWLYRGIDP